MFGFEYVKYKSDTKQWLFSKTDLNLHYYEFGTVIRKKDNDHSQIILRLVLDAYKEKDKPN